MDKVKHTKIEDLERELEWSKAALEDNERREEERKEMIVEKRRAELAAEDETRGDDIETLLAKKKRLLEELKEKVKEVKLEIELIEEHNHNFPTFTHYRKETDTTTLSD